MFPNISGLERRIDENSQLLRLLLDQLKELNENVVRQNELLSNKQQ